MPRGIKRLKNWFEMRLWRNWGRFLPRWISPRWRNGLKKTRMSSLPWQQQLSMKPVIDTVLGWNTVWWTIPPGPMVKNSSPPESTDHYEWYWGTEVGRTGGVCFSRPSVLFKRPAPSLLQILLKWRSGFGYGTNSRISLGVGCNLPQKMAVWLRPFFLYQCLTREKHGAIIIPSKLLCINISRHFN